MPDPAPFLRAVVLDRSAIEDPGEHPFTLPVVRALDRLELPTPVTLLVGENGSGKSTLMEAIAASLGLNPEGGSQNFAFATRESHSALHRALRPVRGARRPRTSFFLRAESFFNVATEIEQLDAPAEDGGYGGGPPIADAYGDRALHEQSHGESFLALLNHRFGPDGLYLLDEPEAAMSPQGLLAVIARMRVLVEEGSQFVIATHAPMLLAYPGATLYEIQDGGLVPTPYEDTDHVRLTRSFLEDPERFLRYL
jgi:predicted ATPase